MKKQSFFSILIPLILLVIGGFIFFLVTTQKQDIRSRASVNKVDLTLSATPNPVAVGSNVVINVLINPKTYKVTAVELVMTYDSAAFEPVSIAKPAANPFLGTVLTAGSMAQTGIATITLGSGTTPKTGSGTLATLKLKKKGTASGIVKVGANTKVAGLNANGSPVSTSILGTAGSVTITSSTSPTGSPTPTGQITNTPTITPTKVPSSTPTPAPTESPTPTVTPVSYSSPTPTEADSGGFGGLTNPPPPIPLPDEIGDSELTEPETTDGFAETPSLSEEAAPETALQEKSEFNPETASPSEDTAPEEAAKPKRNVFLVFLGIISFIGVCGGAVAFILHKKFGYTLPFFKKRSGQTTPPPTPSDQTPQAIPPATDQAPNPAPPQQEQSSTPI